MAIYLIALISLMTHTAFGGSRVVLTLLAIDLGANPFEVGILAALYAICPMLLAIYAGKVIDRVGALAPMLAGTAGVGACLLLAAAIPKLAFLFGAALVLGVSFMMFLIAVQGITGAIGPERDRTRNYGVLSVGFSFAAFLGPLLAGFSIDYLGYRAALLILASCTLVPIVLLWVRRDLVPISKGSVDKTAAGTVSDLLRIPELRSTFIVGGILSAAWDLFNFYMPVYGRHIGLSASAIGMILASFAAATVVIRLVLPSLVRHGGEMRALNRAIYLASFTYVLFPFFENAWALAAIAFVLGLGVGTAQPLSMTLIYSLAPKNRTSEAAGVRVTVNNFSHVAIPLLFGALGSAFGFAPVFISNGVMLLSGALMNQRAMRR